MLLEAEDLEQFQDFRYDVSEVTLRRAVRSFSLIASEIGNAVDTGKAAEDQSVIAEKENTVYPEQTPKWGIGEKSNIYC